MISYPVPPAHRLLDRFVTIEVQLKKKIHIFIRKRELYAILLRNPSSSCLPADKLRSYSPTLLLDFFFHSPYEICIAAWTQKW